ncbi:MAG: DNA mismatch repair endonuclease MutL [Gammaproteobacteria bacterium]
MPVARPIRPLPDQLINQIAAGEVVERPASIVKELVENSLDAGAGTIRIEVRGGGVDTIVVDDDGAGIAGEELALALTRHCTSKIARTEDLDGIVSLGFRGEALASIAAVADVSLTSRAVRAIHGHALFARAGAALPDTQPAARARGTRVEVRALFANVPARRGFLRSPDTETHVIQQLVRGLAFTNPAVTFTLVPDRGRQWHAPAARDERSNAQRWRAVFGAPFARGARFVDVRGPGVRVSGWVAPPALARGQSDLQFMAVNGRLVRDRQLLHAVRLAFGDTLAPGRYASFALHLETAPTAVDVNVHPNKTEVRFRHVRDVHDMVYTATREALAAELTTDTTPSPAGGGVPPTLQVAEDRPRLGRSGWRDTVSPGMARHEASADRREAGADHVRIGSRYIARSASAESLELLDLQGMVTDVLATAGPRVATRALAFPVRVPPPPGPERALGLAAWAQHGLVFEPIGPRQWVLREVPAALPDVDGDALVASLVRGGALAEPSAAATAAACAAALRLPDAPSALADWLDRLAPAVVRARHRAVLDSAALARLVARNG